MTKQCIICAKSSTMVGHRVKLRGKYNPTIRRRKYPNIQWVYIPVGITKSAYKEFAGKRIKACAKCIKSLAKKK